MRDRASSDSSSDTSNCLRFCGSPGESFHCADQKEKSFFALVRLRLRNYAPTAWGLTISLNATKCLVGLQVAFRASAGISITWKAQFGERLRTNLASVGDFST